MALLDRPLEVSLERSGIVPVVLYACGLWLTRAVAHGRYFEPGTLPHDRVYELVHWARRAHAAAFVEQRRVHETDSLVSECSRMIGVKTPDIVRHLEPHVYELLEAFVLNGNSPRMYLFDMLYSLKHKDAHHRREDVVTETFDRCLNEICARILMGTCV